MNYRLSKLHSEGTCWSIVFLFVAYGCQGTSSKHLGALSPAQPSDSGDYVSLAELSRSVQDFHNHLNLASDLQTPTFAITWFPRPYSKRIHILQLFEDGSVLSFAETPGWAVQGGLPSAKLDTDELQSVRAILKRLAEAQTQTTGKGMNVIVLSFNIQAERHIIICTEAECPQEIQDLFEIAERAIQENTSAHALVPSPFESENE